jgi:uncharacterized surface protein with fasciclin (FAS1) repeats
LSLFSCKNEVKSAEENKANVTISDSSESTPENSEPTIEVTPEVKNIMVNSVMIKTMASPKLKTFSSMLVSAGLADLLMKEEGPFTLLGPSNEAFKRLDQSQLKDLLNSSNKSDLVSLIKSHVIEEDLDTAALDQKIKEGNGSFQVVSMSGASYTISRKGAEIVFTDDNGVSAQIVKGEVKGLNGVAHTLDKVLGVEN